MTPSATGEEVVSAENTAFVMAPKVVAASAGVLYLFMCAMWAWKMVERWQVVMARLKASEGALGKVEQSVAVMASEESHTAATAATAAAAVSEQQGGLIRLTRQMDHLADEVSRLRGSWGRPVVGECSALIPPENGWIKKEPPAYKKWPVGPKSNGGIKALKIMLGSEEISGAKKPSFDISTAAGRDALKAWVCAHRKEPLSTSASASATAEAAAEPECPILTYNEIPQSDPTTKKRFKRIHIPNRGWISAKKFEEERARYGGDCPVKMKTE